MGCLTETGKDSSVLRDSSSVSWRGAGEASGVMGVWLSEISGGGGQTELEPVGVMVD